MKNKNKSKIEDLKRAGEKIEAVNVEIVKQRYRRACEATVRDLRQFGYIPSYIAIPEINKVFDITAESPFLDPRKDAGSFIKVAIDSITIAERRAIEDFKTFKKKELWVRYGSGKLAIFKWDRAQLIWQLDGAPLSRFIKPVKKKSNRKGDGFHQPGEGKK